MMQDYRKYLVWEEAIVLATQVHNLIDSLPESERSALAVSLNDAAVSLATSISISLSMSQPPVATKAIALLTQLEMVDRIYPALDTAEVDAAAAKLLAKLEHDEQFRELKPLNLSTHSDSPEDSEPSPDSDDSDDESDEDEDESPQTSKVSIGS
ncbi:MAG: four helix bundle protein [Candidatus Saccharimonadia bacterium]